MDQNRRKPCYRKTSKHSKMPESGEALRLWGRIRSWCSFRWTPVNAIFAVLEKRPPGVRVVCRSTTSAAVVWSRIKRRRFVCRTPRFPVPTPLPRNIGNILVAFGCRSDLSKGPFQLVPLREQNGPTEFECLIGVWEEGHKCASGKSRGLQRNLQLPSRSILHG